MWSFIFCCCLLVVTRAERPTNLTSSDDSSVESCAGHVTVSSGDKYISSYACKQQLIPGTSSYRIQFGFTVKEQVDGWHVIVKFDTETKKMNFTEVQGGELVIYDDMGPKTVVFLNETDMTSTVNVTFILQLIEDLGPAPPKRHQRPGPERRAAPASRAPSRSGPKSKQKGDHGQPWWPAEVEVLCIHCTTIVLVSQMPITGMCNGSQIQSPTLKSRPPPPGRKKNDVHSIQLKFHNVKPRQRHQKDKSDSEDWVTCRLQLNSKARMTSVDHAVHLGNKFISSREHLIVTDVLLQTDPTLTLNYTSSKTGNVTTARRTFGRDEINIECRRCKDDATTEPPVETTEPVFVIGGKETTDAVVTVPVETTAPPECNKLGNCDSPSVTGTGDGNIKLTGVTQTVDGSTERPGVNGSNVDIARTGDEKDKDDDDHPTGLWVGVGIVGAVVLLGAGAAGIMIYRHVHPRSYSPKTAETADQGQTEQPENYTPMKEVQQQGNTVHITYTEWKVVTEPLLLGGTGPDTGTGPVYEVPSAESHI